MGFVDLEIEVCLVSLQVDDVLIEINVCVKVGECVLIIVLMKCMVE